MMVPTGAVAIKSAPAFELVLVGPLPPPSGGMANQTRQLARLLVDEGVRVRMVQTNPPYRPAWLGRLRYGRALARLFVYLFDLSRACRGADLVHVMANSGWAWHLFAAPAVLVARLRGVPVLVNYRGGEAEPFLEKQHRWVRPVLRRASALLVPSGFLQRVFSAHGFTAEIVPNIVDLARFAPGPARTFGARYLVARNLEDIYDVPTAIRAFARIRECLPQAHLTIAGSGPALVALQRLVAELGLGSSVEFVGRQDNDAMARRFREADVLLNSSTVDNMPISLLEAMASGVPIVSTDVGGIPFMVENGRSALLVPARSPEAMADAALRLAADSSLRDRLAGAAAEAASAYAWERVRPRLLRTYERCAGRRLPTECVT
jgi:glycosyltransferase involved in cell wall biosynthesis